MRKTVFLGKNLGIISLLLLIIIMGYSYYVSTSQNDCEVQDDIDVPENIAQIVVRQFEVFQGVDDTVEIASCVSKSFLDNGVLDTQSQNFSVIYVEFHEIVKQNEETLTVKATTKRQYFRSGIGGGSYVYRWVPIRATLKKFDNQWLITNYRDESSNF